MTKDKIESVIRILYNDMIRAQEKIKTTPLFEGAEFHKGELSVLNRTIAHLEEIVKTADQETKELRDLADRLAAELEKIQNAEKDTGREGCTYGDTEYDSLSAVYGYNFCLLCIQDDTRETLTEYNNFKNKHR